MWTATRGLVTTALAASVVVLSAGTAAAQAQAAGVTLTGPVADAAKSELRGKRVKHEREAIIGRKDGLPVVAAVPNGVPILLRGPLNTGNCDLTLQCQAGDGTDVGVPLTLKTGQGVGAFGCGSAARMVFTCAPGSGVCRLSYVP